MSITPIPCLTDNYAYLVVCDATQKAAIVDPSEAKPVLDAVKRASVKPEAIWNTHHHWDHVGGNAELTVALALDQICGHTSDRGRIAAQTRFLEEGDRLELGKLEIRILHIPGHTTGAIAYVVSGDGDSPAVFTGDTLFIAGCGRLFEGTPAMMFESLRKLAALDERTRVYCGHEYTRSNLRFAKHVEEANQDVVEWMRRVDAHPNQPTVPSRIGDEKRINPFVRARDVAELAERRAAKDTFK